MSENDFPEKPGKDRLILAGHDLLTNPTATLAEWGIRGSTLHISQGQARWDETDVALKPVFQHNFSGGMTHEPHLAWLRDHMLPAGCVPVDVRDALNSSCVLVSPPQRKIDGPTKSRGCFWNACSVRGCPAGAKR